MNSQKKVSPLFRGLLILFSLLVLFMITYSFFFSTSPGVIDSGIVTLLSVLLVVLLSETFDNFSIGRIITISREVKKKERTVHRLENEKAMLLNQLISISATQNQSQQHTNVYGDYHAESHLGVESASEMELALIKSDDITPDEKDVPLDRKKVKSLALEKYTEEKRFCTTSLLTDARLAVHIPGFDPVNTFQPVFDCYYREDHREIFLEIKQYKNLNFSVFRARLYMMLTKVHHYLKAKGVQGALELIWVILPSEKENKRIMDKIYLEFEPAIRSGLLRITQIHLSEEEADLCRKVYVPV